jgi:predicted transcriptional regulator
MTPKLTDEQRQALCDSNGPVAIEDDQTQRIYFLVDEPTLRTLRQQSDLAAIREGIADLEAGRVAPLDEVMARIRMNPGIA